MLTCQKENKEQIVALICTPTSKITLTFQAVQEQVGSNDCGAFAIAFATSLCEGIIPSSVYFDQNSLRQHIFNCLVTGRMSSFPGKEKN